MMVIKNKKNHKVAIPHLGIELEPFETRNVDEFATRDALQKYSESIIDLIYADEIAFANADLEEFTKAQAVLIIAGAYSEVKVIETTTVSNTRYLYVNDLFMLYKNNSVTKSFIGNVSSIYIRPDSKDIQVQITSEGVTFQLETVKKLTEYVLETDYKLKNPSIVIKAPWGATNVDIFIDGDTTMSASEMQTYIDNFKE